MRFWLLLLLIFPLVNCAGTSEPAQDRYALLDSAVLDPSDKALKRAVQSFLKEGGAPLASHYQFARFDLDQDGRRDAVVLFQTPYGYWCDMYGCTMLVLKANNNDFTLVNAIQPVRGPLLISQTQSNGWKDLVLRVSGRWDDAKDVAITFDGKEYPSNPAVLPPHPKGARSQYVRVFEK